ncbi:P-loop containing nucleoside triphosphate hydrolase protein, partial [Tilletiaria anomala UBC 951]
GKQLAAEVHLWALRLDKELWTFTHQWQKSKALYASVQATNESDLILSPELLKRLHRDTNTFFESRDIYKSINAPWKRGLLLIGPPGNGKTGALQVLLKSMSHIPVLYVKSCGHAPPSISAIFGKARQTSPCILVFEDLDALINDMTRAYFLNEVDGLENNDGILMIATTNHPERIDDAIMKRPSRFDSKYIFGLPDHNLRKRFILKWLYEKVRDTSIDFDSREYSNPGVSDIDSLADHIASKTEGWSFAFLKEL